MAVIKTIVNAPKLADLSLYIVSAENSKIIALTSHVWGSVG